MKIHSQEKVVVDIRHKHHHCRRRGPMGQQHYRRSMGKAMSENRLQVRMDRRSSGPGHTSSQLTLGGGGADHNKTDVADTVDNRME